MWYFAAFNCLAMDIKNYLLSKKPRRSDRLCYKEKILQGCTKKVEALHTYPLGYFDLIPLELRFNIFQYLTSKSVQQYYPKIGTIRSVTYFKTEKLDLGPTRKDGLVVNSFNICARALQICAIQVIPVKEINFTVSRAQLKFSRIIALKFSFSVGTKEPLLLVAAVG